jgi:hypothetical protein
VERRSTSGHAEDAGHRVGEPLGTVTDVHRIDGTADAGAIPRCTRPGAKKRLTPPGPHGDVVVDERENAGVRGRQGLVARLRNRPTCADVHDDRLDHLTT